MRTTKLILAVVPKILYGVFAMILSPSASTTLVANGQVSIPVRANEITFSERHSETDFPSPPGLYFFIIQDSGLLSAALTVPALQFMPDDTWSNLLLSVTFGDFTFAGSLSAAAVLTSSQAIFYLTYSDDGSPATREQLTVGRSGNTLLMTAQISNLPGQQSGYSGYFYTNYWYPDGPLPTVGPFQDQQSFNLSIQDGSSSETYADIVRTVYITGKITATHGAKSGETHLAQVTGTADYTPPAIAITAPVSGQRWNNGLFAVKGTARDNIQVSNVWIQINGTGWQLAVSTNHWTNWTTSVALVPGTNTVQACALDGSGNASTTKAMSFVYVLSAPLSVGATGEGSISPNYNQARLQLGANYSMTAKATNGFGFVSWTDGSGHVLTNGPILKFRMASNLAFIANFADVTKPRLSVLSPTTATSRWTNGLVTVQVRATDNVAVSKVEFYLNGMDFGPGAPQPASNLWTRNFALAEGTNVVAVVASDSAGNVSTTNFISLVYANQTTNGNAITLSEYFLMIIYPGPPGFLNDIVQDTGVLNAALKVPGLQSRSANTWSNLYLSVSFGYFSFSGSLSGAPVLTTNLAVFNFADTNDPAENPATVEQLTVHRSGNMLLVSVRAGNASNLSWPLSLIAGSYFQWFPYPMEPVLGLTPAFALTLQDGDSLENYFALTNTVYITTKSLGGAVQVTGAADFTPPTNTISSPVNGQRWSNLVFNVFGTARDNEQVSNVWVQVNETGWQLATSSNQWRNWTANVTLSPGTNTVEACAVDGSGNVSATNRVKVVCMVRVALTVSQAMSQPIAPPVLPPSFGNAAISGSGFGFTVTGQAGQVVVVMASTDLASWQPVQTNTLSGAPVRFSDPQWTNYPTRFYRLRSP